VQKGFSHLSANFFDPPTILSVFGTTAWFSAHVLPQSSHPDAQRSGLAQFQLELDQKSEGL
jgi:hypothetical protein